VIVIVGLSPEEEKNVWVLSGDRGWE